MSLPPLPFFTRALDTARASPDKEAIYDPRTNTSYSYSTLLNDVAAFKHHLTSDPDLNQERIVGLLPNGYSWVVAQWATWAAGGLFVPLLHTLPLPEMEYIVNKSGATKLIVCETLQEKGNKLVQSTKISSPAFVLPLHPTFSSPSSASLPEISSTPIDEQRKAFMLFTSGSTGHPKGVPISHRSLASQCASMSETWAWSDQDRVLDVLPMHHIHGVVNLLLTALWNGATCEFMDKFDAMAIWNRWTSTEKPQITLFSAVPTIYSNLLQAFQKQDSAFQDDARNASGRLRLMISGSAPLPVSLKADWESVCHGGKLLERYGMTETGMILSCGLDVASRVDGHVGYPMPGAIVKLVPSSEDEGTGGGEGTMTEGSVCEGAQGEIWVRGDNIFDGYWEDPETTAKEFATDAEGQRWFKTGDVAVLDSVSQGGFRILGRSSVDLIKSGGEKISALEIERALLNLDGKPIKDCAVVGVPDEKWGQAVGAVVVLSDQHRVDEWDVKKLRDILRSQLAAFKLPQKLKIYPESIPRNAMGKVNKKELVRTAFPDETVSS